MKAAIYARVSTNNGQDPGLQTRELREYLERRGWELAGENGPIEIAPGTHRMPREAAMRSVERGQSTLRAVPLEIGDVLIRHRWALHRGTPNLIDMPRAMTTVRYVRRWYADASREVNAIPTAAWQSLTPDQQEVMRFPINK